MTFPQFSPLGDSAVLIRLGDRIDESIHDQVMAATQHLTEHDIPGVLEIVPAYASLAVHYDPGAIPSTSPYDGICQQLNELWRQVPVASPAPGRVVDIPVCYDAEFGPDQTVIAEHAKLP